MGNAGTIGPGAISRVEGLTFSLAASICRKMMASIPPVPYTPDDDATAVGPDESQPPFVLTAPSGDAPPSAVIYATPHSGRIYPARLRAASRLDLPGLRRSEDAHVDRLIADAPGLGVPVLAARYARAWLDVNRDPWELDPAMFDGPLPTFVKARTPRVAAGLGAVAKIVAEGQDIYRRKLTFSEATQRIEAIHRPYHEALMALIRDRLRARGACVALDWHSMPAAAAGPARGAPDIVLGDLFGVAASPRVTRRVETEFTALGYRVARNSPFAGAYTTERHGCPAEGVHVVQVEINRAIYLDEATLEPNGGFSTLKSDLAALTARLAAWDVTDLIPATAAQAPSPHLTPCAPSDRPDDAHISGRRSRAA